MTNEIAHIEPEAYAAELDGFGPTDAMRRAKTSFWNSVPDKSVKVTLASAIVHSGATSLRNWWGKPGFVEWFTGQNEWRNRVECLAMRGLDIAEQLLHDRRTTPASKVQLIKLFAELADKMPSRQKDVRYIDAQIADMTPEQLTDFIEKNTPTHTPEVTDGL
jgi:hypothetical protein